MTDSVEDEQDRRMAKAATNIIFETAFDAGVSGPRDPRDRYLQNEPKFGDKDLERARKQAFEQGVEAGIEQARASYEAEMAALFAELAGQVRTMIGERQALAEELRCEAARLAHAIATRLAPRLMRAHPLTEIEAMVGDCLAERHGEPRIVIRVSEDQLDGLRARLEQMAEQHGLADALMLRADPDIGAGNCRVEWQDGGAERDVEKILEAAAAAVNRYLELHGSDVPVHTDVNPEPEPETAAPASGEDATR